MPLALALHATTLGPIGLFTVHRHFLPLYSTQKQKPYKWISSMNSLILLQDGLLSWGIIFSTDRLSTYLCTPYVCTYLYCTVHCMYVVTSTDTWWKLEWSMSARATNAGVSLSPRRRAQMRGTIKYASWLKFLLIELVSNSSWLWHSLFDLFHLILFFKNSKSNS